MGNKGILGGKNTKDNFPLSKVVTIKEVVIPTPAEQKTQEETAQGEPGKSTPGFTGITVLVSLIVIGLLKVKRR